MEAEAAGRKAPFVYRRPMVSSSGPADNGELGALRAHVAELEAIVTTASALRERAARAEAEARDLRAELRLLRDDIEALAEHRTLEAFTHQQHLELRATAAQRDELLDELAQVTRRLTAAEARVNELEASTSWRLTSPARRVAAILKGE